MDRNQGEKKDFGVGLERKEESQRDVDGVPRIRDVPGQVSGVGKETEVPGRTRDLFRTLGSDRGSSFVLHCAIKDVYHTSGGEKSRLNFSV